MEKMELMDELQVHYKDFVKRMKGRVSYDDYETQSLLEGYTEELASFISKELDKAREEGKREAFTKDEWFMLKLAMNDIFNSGNSAYEGISEKIKGYLN